MNRTLVDDAGLCYGAAAVQRGCTPLHMAAKEGEAETCRLLLKLGADVGCGDQVRGSRVSAAA